MEIIVCAEYELIGVNGISIGECGISLPVGHKKGEDRYFSVNSVFYEKGFSDVELYSLKKIESYEERGLLRCFNKPCSMILNSRVVYASDEFLRDVAVSSVLWPPDEFEGVHLDWQDLSTPPKRWVACTSEESAKRVLNQWSEVLYHKTESQIAQYYRTKNQTDKKIAERLAQNGIYASNTPRRREDFHVFKAVLLGSENDSLLRERLWSFLAPTLPGIGKDHFFQRVICLEKSLSKMEPF